MWHRGDEEEGSRTGTTRSVVGPGVGSWCWVVDWSLVTVGTVQSAGSVPSMDERAGRWMALILSRALLPVQLLMTAGVKTVIQESQFGKNLTHLPLPKCLVVTVEQTGVAGG